MRYKKIPAELFIKNRSQFAEKMDNNSVAIFNSNDLMPKNADQNLPFFQNSDLFYLSGIDQEESLLMIVKKESNIGSYLFLRETNDLIKVWEGEKLDKNNATSISGIKNVYWDKSFEKVLNTYVSNCSVVYLNSNEHPRAEIIVETRDARFEKWIKKKFPNKKYKKSTDILYPLRAIKDDLEIELIKTACDITADGVKRVLSFLRPGVMEYEIEAEIAHEFIKSGSRGFAYDPIIASGQNSCVLHYNNNNKVCASGDIVLMDFGAEYSNYCSDLTRCFPVSGRFSNRQRQVYNSVLRVMKSAKKMLCPGLGLKEYEINVGKLMEKELVDLQLISLKDIKNQEDLPAYKKYYMHGTSHHLGLDVHDVSGSNQPLQPGMVLTCEPGIYIPEEGFGIRLENDIVIGHNENIDLMSKIPIEAEEIEEILNN